MRLSLVLVLGLFLSVGTLQAAHASYSDISISDPTMVDSTGHALSSYQVGQDIGVQSVLTNHGTTDQNYAYMVQVVGSAGETDYFEASSASLLGNQSFTVVQAWIPKDPGTYTVQVFVWNGLASAVPLTNVIEKQITVQA
ncbi:MAG: hypothetical protein KGH88_08420 [Thaumarchaeota archaeon]|nr:hypothetical protein [Nitrososphaerota archaeon]